MTGGFIENSILLFLANFNRYNLITLKVGFRHRVSAGDVIDYIHTFNHLPEDGVTAVQLRGRHKGDKELAPVGVPSGIRHGKHTRLVKGEVAVFIYKGVTRSTHSATGWITPLRHETIQHPMESGSVKIAVSCQEYKAIHGDW